MTQPFHTQTQSLKALNTFGFDVVAHHYLPIESPEDLSALFLANGFENQPYGILGGGSNITFTQDYSGLLLHNRIKGCRIVEENADDVIVEFGGGENWHETVLYTLEKGWGGLEKFKPYPWHSGCIPHPEHWRLWRGDQRYVSRTDGIPHSNGQLSYTNCQRLCLWLSR